MSEGTERDYVLRFRPLPDPDGVPSAVRVRRLLKTALRWLHLRCVSIESAPPAGGEQPGTDWAPQDGAKRGG